MASDATVGTLRVLLTADQTEFNAAMKAAAAQVKSVEKTVVDSNAKMAATGKGVSSSFGNIGAAAGQLRSLFPAAGIVGVGVLAKQFIEANGALVDLAANTGLGLSALQKFKFGAEQTGSSIDAVVKAVQFGQKALVEGDKSFVGGLKQIGLSLDEVRAMKPEDFFSELSSRIAAVEDPAQRTALRMALMGRTGRELAGDFKALGAEAEALGLVLADDVVKGADDLGDNFDKLVGVGKSLIGTVLSPLLPLMNGLLSVVNTLGGALMEHLIGPFYEFLNPARQWRDLLKGINDGLELMGIRAATLPKVTGDAAAGVERMNKAVADRANLNVVDALKDEEAITKELTDRLKANNEAREHAIEWTKKQNDAVDALNRTQDDQIEKLRSMGVMTQEVAAKSLAPLIEKLNLAAAAGDQQLRVALITLEPELEDIGQAMRNSGLETQFLTDMLEELKRKADSLPPVIQRNFDDLSNIVENTFGDSTEIVRKAFEDYPKIAQVELPKVADEVKGLLPTFRGVFDDITGTASDAFSEMLSGGRGFKDGLLDIWDSIRRGIADILSQILDDFMNRFLGGLINAMLGRQGGFQSAFSGMFSGLIPGLGGVGGAGGLAGGGFGSGAGIAGSGSYTVGGMAGTPWWSTGLGGGAIGGAAGAAAGWYVGGQTGNTWGSAGAGAGVGAGVGAALGGPVGAGIGALIGAGVGWYRAKQENKRTNDVRDEYLAQFGGGGTGEGSGFHTVAAQLTAAGYGAGGGQLFQDLITQNDREGLAKAIEAVNKALAEYEARTKAATAAEGEHAAAITETTSKLEGERDEVLAQLSDTHEQIRAIVADGLEEHEQAALDSLRTQEAYLLQQLEQIRAAQIASGEIMTEAVDGAATAATDAAMEIADGIESSFSLGEDAAREFADLLALMGRQGKFDVEGSIRLAPEVYALGNAPTVTPDIAAASGFHGWVNGPTHILAGEAGRERVDISPAGHPTSGRGGAPMSVTFNISALDGADVRRIVEGREFQQAFVHTMSRNINQFGYTVALNTQRFGGGR